MYCVCNRTREYRSAQHIDQYLGGNLADYNNRDRDREGPSGEGNSRGDSEERRPFRARRDFQRRPRACPFCSEKMGALDYKDVPALRRFIAERGRIMPRRRTAACARHQRLISTAIKRARQIALLPYTAEHTRTR